MNEGQEKRTKTSKTTGMKRKLRRLAEY